jgi:hypothetical protein
MEVSNGDHGDEGDGEDEHEDKVGNPVVWRSGCARCLMVMMMGRMMHPLKMVG